MLEFYKFCKNYNDEIISILNEFNKVYNTIIDSSQDIERVFKSALIAIYSEKHIRIKLENIHIEEFTKIIINDNFTQVIIFIFIQIHIYINLILRL